MSHLSLTTQLIAFQPRLKAAKSILNDYTQMHAIQPHSRQITNRTNSKHHPYSTLSAVNNYPTLKPSMPHKKVKSGQLLQSVKKARKTQLYQNMNFSSLAKYQAFAEGKLQFLEQRPFEIKESFLEKEDCFERGFSRSHHSPQPIGPHININLQMLIKKRKPSGSELSKKYQLLLYSSRRK